MALLIFFTIIVLLFLFLAACLRRHDDDSLFDLGLDLNCALDDSKFFFQRLIILIKLLQELSNKSESLCTLETLPFDFLNVTGHNFESLLNHIVNGFIRFLLLLFPRPIHQLFLRPNNAHDPSEFLRRTLLNLRLRFLLLNKRLAPLGSRQDTPTSLFLFRLTLRRLLLLNKGPNCILFRLLLYDQGVAPRNLDGVLFDLLFLVGRDVGIYTDVVVAGVTRVDLGPQGCDRASVVGVDVFLELELHVG